MVAACSAATTPTTTTTSVPVPIETTTTSTDAPTTTSSVPATTTTTTIAVAPPDTGDIVGFDLAEVTLGEEVLLVAVADTATKRGRGLMFVEDFGEVDGMLFVFDQDVNNRFFMRDTLVSLDIAFFSAEGVLIDLFDMVPCEESPCVRYQPAGVYRYALERPAGTLVGVISAGDVLDVGGLVP